MQSTIASSSTPMPPGGLPSPAINGLSLSEQSRSASPAAQPKLPASKSKAMQLGVKSPGLPPHGLADDLADEIAANEAANPWGTDDLIDVNADEDDWSAFETAPISTPIVQSPTHSTTTKLASLPTSRPASKSPVPQVKIVHATFPGSFDTPISTPSSSRTPEPSWGNEGDWDAPAPAASVESARKTAGSPSTPMSKEEKAAEMARRKEERRQVSLVITVHHKPR